MTWRDDRRADRAAEARIRNEEKAAAAQVRIAERAALAAERRTDEAARVERARVEADRRGAKRAARLAAVRAWLSNSVVQLLIYPIALLSFALAAPAIAIFGNQVYDTGVGALLPGITELGMWAFAIAVHVSRQRHPDRPTGRLQAGVWLFAGFAFVTNLLHGLAAGWQAGFVMGLVSVAGVIAHQLTVAAPPRSRAERAAIRAARRHAAIDAAAARKVARIRKAAVRAAVAEIDPDGTARLVFAPGRYELSRRGQLTAATVPGLPVTAEADEWDRALVDLLATADAPAVEPPTPADDGPTGGGVATLDSGPDPHESTPDRPTVNRRPGRSLAQLRAELAAAVEAGRVNPGSAQSIRKALRCAAATARQLRDEHQRGGQQ